MNTKWPQRCPDCGAGVVFGGTPDADYDCDHWTRFVGEVAPWWIALPGWARRLLGLSGGK